MPNIIHSNQSGYVEGRFIGETIRTIDDIMDFTKCEGIGGILAFLDFEKAFDSVEWNFLHKCLDVFNFGSDLKLVRQSQIVQSVIDSSGTVVPY